MKFSCICRYDIEVINDPLDYDSRYFLPYLILSLLASCIQLHPVQEPVQVRLFRLTGDGVQDDLCSPETPPGTASLCGHARHLGTLAVTVSRLKTSVRGGVDVDGQSVIII